MLAFGGLGGVATIAGVIIGGDGIRGLLQKSPLPEGVPPVNESALSLEPLGTTLIVVGVVVMIGALGVRWWRRRRRGKKG
uniref:Uncharacterized protein n=1 Tax=Candidatus Kentrum sp. DK TaxID=2126562 RepID=A0A450SRE4_9GAMM|nr:MAG: hypothetical protein BECKDK2373B_GA0170837_10609 [Candidatus Kentron sp. DK]